MVRTAAPDRHGAAGPSAPAGPQRLLTAGAANLDEHRRRNGALPHYRDRDQLVSTVEAAGLAGRGGAGFPMWRKLAAVAAGERPVAVANGAETEPASTKDRTLLSSAPHLVLDGLRLAAQAVGARHAYVYLPAGSIADSIRSAIAERRAAGWDRARVDVVEAPNWFVAGEQSALTSAIEGRSALPRDKRRRVVEAGVHGRPTLVQNVETLAHLALIARHGPAWFRSQGTAAEPGTFLATVSGAVAAAGVYEAPYGIPLQDLLAVAGGPKGALQAVLLGGYHGAWIPASEADVAVSRAALAPLGASPGAGVVVALPTTRCGLADSAHIAAYLARQSAGQCGPCLNGLPRLADTLTRLADRRPDPGLTSEVRRLAALVTGRGACQHPDGTARFVQSALRVFGNEVRLHLAGRCTEDAERTSG